MSDANEEQQPHPDDFTVCLYCDRLMVFNDDLTLREPTNEEAIEADMDGAVAEARQITKAFRHLYERRGNVTYPRTTDEPTDGDQE